MIIINNAKFAKNETEFIDSLFKGGGTCVGYYKRYKKSLVLFDHNKQRIGVINRYGVLCKARKLDNGKYWYSYGTIKEVGEQGFTDFDNDLKYIAKSKQYNGDLCNYTFN